MANELPLNGFYAGISQKNSDRRCVNWIPCGDPEGSLSTNYLDCPNGLLQNGPHPVSSFESDYDYSGISTGEITGQILSSSSSKVPRLSLTGGPAAVIPYQTFLMYSYDGSSKPHKLNNLFGSFEYTRMAESQAGIALCSPRYVSSNFMFPNEFGQYLSTNYLTLTKLPLGTFSNDPYLHDVCFTGGRYIWCSFDTSQFSGFRLYYSDIGEFEPKETNFISPDTSISMLTGCHSYNGTLLAFDQDQTFVFSVTASETTPFQWQRASVMPVGCAAPMAKAEAAGSLYLIGRSAAGGYSVFAYRGGYQKFSTPAIDKAIDSSLSGLTDFQRFQSVRVFAYRENGRDYVSFTIPGRTFVLSVTDGRWFERDSGNGDWECIGYASTPTGDLFVGKTVSASGGDVTFNISNPHPNVGTEFGQIVERYMVSGPVNVNNQPLRLSEIEPVCEVDLTEPVEGYENPKIAISPSYDFGYTFEQERSLNIGASGVYDQRTRFLNFGLVRQALVVKFRAYLPYPVRLLKMLARIQPGGRES